MIAIDIKKTRIRVFGSVLFGRRVIMKTEIRLMWIPGIRPVSVPVRVPANNAKIRSSIMFQTRNIIRFYFRFGIKAVVLKFRYF